MTRTWLFRVLRGSGAAALLAATLGGIEADIVLRTSVMEVLHALDRWKFWAWNVLGWGVVGIVVGLPLSAMLGAAGGNDAESLTLQHQTGRDPAHAWMPWVLGGVFFVVCAALLLPWGLGAGSPRPGPGEGTTTALAFVLAAATALGSRVFIRRIDFTGRGQGIAYMGLPTALVLTMSFAVSAPMAGGKGTGIRAREGTPDVLLITVDGLRFDHAGTRSRVRTPAMRWLAENGVEFSQAVTPSTAEVPAAGALLTGRHPLSTGLLADGRALPRRMPITGKELLTLPEIFSREGYSTAAFVSSSALDGLETGLARGFDVYDDGLSPGPRGAHRLALPQLRSWVASAGVVPSARGLLRPSAQTVVRYSEWLDRHYRENTFVWLQLSDPRIPFVNPGLREDALLDPIPGEAGAAFGGRVSGLDLVLEELFQGLETDGLMERTVVIVVGQRGWAPGGRRPGVTDAWVRVAWIMYGPGIPKGLRIDRQARLEDLPATVLSAAGFHRSMLGDGRSLMPLMAGRDLAPVPAIIVGTPRRDGKAPVALRTPTSKYVRTPKGGAAYHDLRNDPREITDVAAENPGETAAAATLLDKTLGRFVPVAVVPPLDPGRELVLRGLEAAW
jgi:arylsulfatase A-like enzyme